MLTFISYWRAAAIVLNDLGSSAFYAAASPSKPLGSRLPWFILGVMLFSPPRCARFFVRAVSMFFRGGVYAWSGLLMFGTFVQDQRLRPDCSTTILTGPISGVFAAIPQHA